MKTKTKVTHTPGPWTIDSVYALIMGPDDEEIAAVHAAQGSMSMRCNPAIAKANASLIAAAPDLLEALQMVCEVGTPSPSEWRIIRAAIAKAEGCK